jgi:hypothetical protein
MEKPKPKRPRIKKQKGRSPRNQVHKSLETNSAEHAAQILVKELKTKGYDPKTGGELLLKDTESEEMDKDRYQLTPEEEERLDEEKRLKEEHAEMDNDYEQRDDYTEYTEGGAIGHSGGNYSSGYRSDGYATATSATTATTAPENYAAMPSTRPPEESHGRIHVGDNSTRRRRATTTAASVSTDDHSWVTVDAGWTCFSNICP